MLIEWPYSMMKYKNIMPKITSLHNPMIKSLCGLRMAKYRKQRGQFIAEGMRTCMTLIDAGCQPITFFILEEMIKNEFQLINKYNIVLITPRVMKKISTMVTPSGILGLFSIKLSPKDEITDNGIVLASVRDPGNMGTLIRSAAAMNVRSVIVIDGVDPWSSKVVQASVGTIGYVTIFQISWVQLCKFKKTTKLYALVVSGGNDIKKIGKKDKWLLVIGNEASGIPSEWADGCDEKVTLVMPGKVESLNASVAGSIALYHFTVYM